MHEFLKIMRKKRSYSNSLRSKPKAAMGRRIKCFFLLLLLAFVLYIFVGGDNGLYQIWHLKRWIGTLGKEISALEEERELLEQECHLLETDVDYIEKEARERYGMIKEGETIFEVHPPKKK